MPRLSKIGAAALAAFGWTSGANAVSASYLQVAGGGGGAGGNSAFQGGGGGAGGLLTGTTSLDLTLSYTVTVGAGGVAGVGGNATQGSNSQFGTLTASVGGGYGANRATAGGTGGSGGGGGDQGGSGSAGAGGSATSGQGNTGGNGATGTAFGGAGGGGGAGAVGSNASTNSGGNGGAGTASSITGTSVTYAGGGGGGGNYNQSGTGGTGGSGGGGTANQSLTGSATSGTANTGGGGGGSSYTAGSGGSGVVIISYASPQKFGGGIVTTSGANTIHTFQTSGTLSPLSTLSASYLIVAGGGGAGCFGGGGAGGYQTGSGVTIDTNSVYVVTVGAGGAGVASGAGGGGGKGSNGVNSSFSAYATASVGGGAGGGYVSNQSGSAGGSGGGGGYSDPIGSALGGAGASGQGNAGGSGFIGGAGGGGASAAGSNGGGSGSAGVGGAGGNGTASSITGSSVTYAGGGGGGNGDARTGGSGGAGGTGGGGAGGTGALSTGAAGTANLGGGGGGGGSGTSTNYGGGGAGGSGIVIISYAGATQSMAGGTVTISGGNVIHTFTSSGYLTPLKLVNNSLRFRSSASASLSRTPPTTSNRKTWTWSGWVKRGTLGSFRGIFTANYPTVSWFFLGFGSGNTLDVAATAGSSASWQTTALFRDPAAWYHVVLAVDTTSATSTMNGSLTDRFRLFVNGTQYVISGGTVPTQNADLQINNTVSHTIGGYSGEFFDGYLSEINFIDGQALTPNSFGTFNSYGVWQPITYGGSYGTNGFYLPFTNKTSTTTLGYDFSPAGNNWTTNNISLTTGSTYDSMTDVPTLTSATAANTCVYNPLNKYTATSVSNGNLLVTNGSSPDGWSTTGSTMAFPATGKFYAEFTIVNRPFSGTTGIGIVQANISFINQSGDSARFAWGRVYFDNNGIVGPSNASVQNTTQAPTYTTGDVISVAFNADNGTVWWAKNGTFTNSGNPAAGTNPAYTGLTASAFPMGFVVTSEGYSSSQIAGNWGQQPFVYTAPSGFLPLNTYNL